MENGRAHIIVTIETKNPIEVGDFVSAFTSVASQFDKFIKDNHPGISGDARIFVKEVSRGSIIADLLPFAPLLGLDAIVPQLEQIKVIEEFIEEYGFKLKAYFIPGGKDARATSSDLKDFMGAVSVIANDPDGNSKIEAAYFKDGQKKVTATLKFNTREAIAATQHIEEHRIQIQSKEHLLHKRMMMVFTQSNVKNSAVERRTGERVQIDELHDGDLPLIYASDLAEQKIKHEIREADDNVYKKGFVVDVFVQTKGGRPLAYKVAALHQVIDLPEY